MPETIVAVAGTRYADLSIEERCLLPAGVRLVSGWGGTPAELIALCQDAVAVLVGSAPRFTVDVLQALPRLRLIVRYGIGVDNVDLEAAAAAGILVANVPDYSVDEVSTHAVALILAAQRKLLAAHRLVREGGWGIDALGPLNAPGETTVGLVGLGRIGRLTAAKLQPFGYRLLGYDPYVPAAAVRDLGVTLVALAELLAEADVISLHVPLTPGTHHLVDAGALARMKVGAWVVNTARGGLIDEAALVDALARGRLGGAALDTFEREPLPPDSPLRHLDNVILTPHVAWYTRRAEREVRERAAAEVLRFLRQEPLRHPVHADS